MGAPKQDQILDPNTQAQDQKAEDSQYPQSPMLRSTTSIHMDSTQSQNPYTQKYTHIHMHSMQIHTWLGAARSTNPSKHLPNSKPSTLVRLPTRKWKGKAALLLAKQNLSWRQFSAVACVGWQRLPLAAQGQQCKSCFLDSFSNPLLQRRLQEFGERSSRRWAVVAYFVRSLQGSHR